MSGTTDPPSSADVDPQEGPGRPAPRRQLVEALAVPSMVGIGALVAVQSQLNGELAQRLGGGFRAAAAAAVISFGTGLALLALAVALLPGTRVGLGRLLRAVRARELRPTHLLGGAAGALLVVSQGLTVGTIGVALFTVAVVAGQTSSALLVDRLGSARRACAPSPRDGSSVRW